MRQQRLFRRVFPLPHSGRPYRTWKRCEYSCFGFWEKLFQADRISVRALILGLTCLKYGQEISEQELISKGRIMHRGKRDWVIDFYRVYTLNETGWQWKVLAKRDVIGLCKNKPKASGMEIGRPVRRYCYNPGKRIIFQMANQWPKCFCWKKKIHIYSIDSECFLSFHGVELLQ